MAERTLVVDDLHVRYGGVEAVRGLSFEVRPGEIVGLIGANGAGKSSTLHAIMGVAPVTGGDIRLGDASLRGRRPEDVARDGVALVPEGRRIFGELTVEENLRLGFAARRGARRHGSGAARRLRPLPDHRGVPRPACRRALGRPAAAARDRARARRRAGRPAARRAVARARADRRRRRLRRARGDPRARPRRSSSSSSARSARSQRPTAATCSRTASFVSRSARTRPPTPMRSWRPTSHDARVLEHHAAGVRRRGRARRRLRADGGRHRPRLRRAAARQLRVRPARDGRRVRARARVGVGVAALGRDRPLLRGRARALAGDGLPRLPAAARPHARRHARRDVRDRVPAPEHRARLVRAAREDRDARSAT